MAGVVISLHYCFGVVRAIYWSEHPADRSPIQPSKPIRVPLYPCIAGMFYLGLFPNSIVQLATRAAELLR